MRMAGTRASLREALAALVRCNPFRWLPAPLLARLLVVSGVFEWKWFGRDLVPPPRTALESARAFVARRGVAARAAGDGAAGAAVHSTDATDAANPLFDADWYRARHGVRGTPAQALLHFRWIGERFGLQPSPWFDNRWFRRQAGMPRRLGSSLARFRNAWTQGHAGHPLFDADWYLAAHPDIAAIGENPLVHFVLYGRHEGRAPNEFFNAAWYAKHYNDVAVAGLEPARHFFEHGAAEGRSPGPGFDPQRYAALYPEQRSSGLDPLAHYLRIGRTLGHETQHPYLAVADLAAAPPPAAERAAPDGVVDIIVPVYRGLAETRDCIESVLASASRVATRLRIYDDASPEPALGEYLRALAAREPRVILVANAANLGFVGTVNRAMRAALAEPDSLAVVLLNSDTVVAGDWVDRLFAHVRDATDVASVTALSNNATICSYPHLGANPLPPGRSAGDVDALAREVNAGRAVEVPTGVGFCMLLTRGALEAVGLFDEAAFGKGYGEENDFCLRALAAGYRHLLALDVFVAHVGEVSFAGESAPGKQAAERVIAARYPHYGALVGRWIERDPALAARLRLTFALWRASPAPVHVLVTHDLGGGTERQVQRLVAQLGASGHVVVVRPVEGRPTRLRLENASAFDGFATEVDVGDGAGLAALLATLGATSVQVHHLLGHGELVRDGLARSDLGHAFFVHDFFSLCPQVTLTTARGDYCGEPDAAGCDACIRERPSHGASDIRNWRLANAWAIQGARAVQAPSHDAAQRIERYFGVLPEVRRHEPVGTLHAAPIVRRAASAAQPLRVVLLGVLAAHKGRRLVIDAATAAQRKGLPLRFHLIGDPQGPVPAEAAATLHWTGWYDDARLPDLIAEAAPDLFLFASQAPETYSFTLTAAKATGLPIVATALGAFPERLQPYPAGRLVPHDISGEALAERLVAWFVEPQ
jgi:GT2 family glycosyltransferase